MHRDLMRSVYFLSVLFSIGHVSDLTILLKRPKIPLKMSLPPSFGLGSNLTLSGVPKCNPKRISLWLLSGPYYGVSDAPLHVDIRFRYLGGKPRVVLASKFSGKWMPTWDDEEDNPGYFPMKEEDFFDINIFVGPDTYLIDINGAHFYYHHQGRGINVLRYLMVLNDALLDEVGVADNPEEAIYDGMSYPDE